MIISQLKVLDNVLHSMATQEPRIKSFWTKITLGSEDRRFFNVFTSLVFHLIHAFVTPSVPVMKFKTPSNVR